MVFRYGIMKRIKKGNHAGFAHSVYESDWFEVQHWFLDASTIKQTEVSIVINTFKRITVRLEGHCTFKSDAGCIAVFTPTELLKAFRWAYKQGNVDGRNHIKIKFHKLLEMES